MCNKSLVQPRKIKWPTLKKKNLKNEIKKVKTPIISTQFLSIGRPAQWGWVFSSGSHQAAADVLDAFSSEGIFFQAPLLGTGRNVLHL